SLESPNFLKPKDLHIPGDFSSAAFVIIAALITKNSNVLIKDVGLNYFRIGLIDVLNKMNAKIKISNKRCINGELIGDIRVKSSKLSSTTVNRKVSPRLIDEYPVLFVAASYAQGISRFYGLSELKLKESDRLRSMADALTNAGVKIKETRDSMEILGKEKNIGGNTVETRSDHRIAMSMLVFGLACEKSIKIDDMKMIKTSFPKFKEILEKIGARIEYIQK
ncbi:MAG: hypothetical protein CMM95_02530, partial [Rickettsiales bacterium]|nr:hypothetical protein [Rickettsiales bacterium]